MPILIKNNDDFNSITSSDYTSERELQEILADNPALLVNETDPPIALVKTEVNLPSTGNLGSWGFGNPVVMTYNGSSLAGKSLPNVFMFWKKTF